MTPPYGRKPRRIEEALDESERGEWKGWLKTQHSKIKDHGIQSPHLMANGWGNDGNSERFYFLGLQKSLQMVTAAVKSKDTYLLLGRKAMINLDSILRSRDITLLTKVCLVKCMVFPVVMLWVWELDHKESWAPKNWCFWTVVLVKTLESPIDCREIRPVNPKGNQSCIFMRRTNAEASILGPLFCKELTHLKRPWCWEDWRRKEKGMTEDKMVGWHHWLDGHEFAQTLGVGEGQVSLDCCIPQGRKELDTTEQLNWTDMTMQINIIWLVLRMSFSF